MPKTTALSKPGIAAILLLFLFLSFTANAQLKVGENPTSIQKSSVLELESTRQGLLLPRLSDTAAINQLTPPNGMLIYLTSDNSLRIRSAGAWKKLANMAEASANWSLLGNTGIDSAANFIGNKDAQPLSFKTDDSARMIIGSNGNVGIGTTTPGATLNVNGTVKFENLGNGSTEVDVLVLNADGSVYKRTMPSTVFDNALKAINGIQTQSLTITADASTGYDSVAVASTTADSTIAIHLPVQDGQSGATKPYGLLTFADWEKINATILNIQTGTVSTQGHANGITIDSTANTRTLILHPADATNPGIVSAGTQTFGGNKTFQDSVTLQGPLTLNTVSGNTSSDTVLVLNNGIIEKRRVSEAAFGNAIHSINNLRDTAQAIAVTTSGTDLSISTNGADSIFLNVPDASTLARGVVTTTAQTFGGNKTFQDSLTVGGPITLNTLTNNTSSDSVLVVNNGIIEKRKVSDAAFGNAIRSMNSLRDSAQAVAFTSAGTDLTVSTNGVDSIFLNVPSASTSARGVITTGTQAFGGNKTFEDSVTALDAIKVGAAGNANSTMQVAGSISMAIRTISANATLAVSDNTVLVNTTSAAVTVTLPAASGIAGRIYTIKKIGTGGIDKELTISPGSATIDGGNSYVIYNDWTFVTLQTDGTDWFIIKK